MNQKDGGAVNGKDGNAAPESTDPRAKRCCFTGHRPQFITRPIDDVKVDLENAIMTAVKDGYRTFITGMARGVDLWAGSIVDRLKLRFPDIKLIAVIPSGAAKRNGRRSGRSGFTGCWERRTM